VVVSGLSLRRAAAVARESCVIRHCWGKCQIVSFRAPRRKFGSQISMSWGSPRMS
jgi:hypothetical protein